MAKFIKITQACSVSRYQRCEYTGEMEAVRDVVYDPIYINIDRIESIFPQGDKCIINIVGGERITAAHPALWVLAQINGQ